MQPWTPTTLGSSGGKTFALLCFALPCPTVPCPVPPRPAPAARPVAAQPYSPQAPLSAHVPAKRGRGPQVPHTPHAPTASPPPPALRTRGHLLPLTARPQLWRTRGRAGFSSAKRACAAARCITSARRSPPAKEGAEEVAEPRLSWCCCLATRFLGDGGDNSARAVVGLAAA